MKWIGGVILLIITIILLLIAIFMFPWFITKTTYEREKINDERPEYWEENLGGFERDWDESTYYLQHYNLKTSRPWNWTKNNSKESVTTGDLTYNSVPESGGWEGSYRSMVDAGYPPPGFLAGGEAQLNVYNFTYYMVLISIILACIGVVFIIIAGLEKMSVIVPKVMVGVLIIFVVLAPIYFALALPPAIETDYEQMKKVDTSSQNNTRRPAEAGGIMGSANEKDDAIGKVTSSTDFAPGIGWWLAIVAIFTAIITLGFVTGPAPAGTSPPDYSRRKYHEFDNMYNQDSGYDQGQGYDEYHRDRGDRPGYQDDYYNDYTPPPRQRPAQPSQYEYGRPAPRPPRRPGAGAPPGPGMQRRMPQRPRPPRRRAPPPRY